MAKNFDDAEKISVNLILEALGRPPEHLVETLKSIVKQIGEEKGVSVKDSRVHEPNLIKDQKELYTNFAEIELEADGTMELVSLIFKYMPSHVEVVHPEKLSLNNIYWNDIFNEITRRLHAYDEVARVIQNEKVILETKLKEILEKKKK
jgi:hypothetical protein